MANILIVDDEPINLEILNETLRKDHHDLIEANDGEQAWEKLADPASHFDCVVLDLKMPRLGGMELARRVKADQRLHHLPLIMQTASAKPENAAQGLALGVFCYLSKPCDNYVVRAAVKAALVQGEERRALSASLADDMAFFDLVTHAQFVLRTFEQARTLAAVVSRLGRDPYAAALGINELLTNAIEHGNLNLDYADKSRLLESGQWQCELARRFTDPKYSTSNVRVELTCEHDVIAVKISDQGQGFDWKPYLSIDPDRAFELHGRGIGLSRQLSFRTVEYLGNGNTVVAKFDRAPKIINAHALPRAPGLLEQAHAD